MMCGVNLNDEEGFEGARMMFGPTQVDREIRQAIQFCWMSLPKEKRTFDELERQIRRIFERALGDAREDFGNFFAKKSPE
jgi:hypothetical protein